MAVANPPQIVHEVIEAHGGIDYWNTLDAVEAEISARGFLFTAKRRPVLQRVRMQAATREPRFSFFDFPNSGQSAEIIGNDEVRIINCEGTVIARRKNPRAVFRGFRRQFAWDDLDFIYFGGYATWNYLTTPFLLARKELAIEVLDPMRKDTHSLIRLKVTFPHEIPIHSPQQIFYFDDQRLLRRIDYTAIPLRWSVDGRGPPTCVRNTVRLTDSRLRLDDVCFRCYLDPNPCPDLYWLSWRCIQSGRCTEYKEVKMS